MIRKILLAILATTCLALTACTDFGQVVQGRTVAFDAEKRVVTFIKDSAVDSRNPQYTVLPPVSFTLPTVRNETGTLPRPGLRMELDTEKRIITMFNPEKQNFEEIPFELVDEHKGVDVSKKHVLVYDVVADKPLEFPQIDNEKRTVTIYSQRQQVLATIKVSEDVFARYTGDDWGTGDVVRIYYKESGTSLRFMNVTRTNIFRK